LPNSDPKGKTKQYQCRCPGKSSKKSLDNKEGSGVGQRQVGGGWGGPTEAKPSGALGKGWFCFTGESKRLRGRAKGG